MNPSQIAAMSTLLSVQQRPRIVDWASATAAADTLVSPLPHRREAGLLALYLACSNGSAAAGTPSGWTSIQTGTAVIASRLAYKFLDGSEDPTISNTSTGATTFAAITMTIAGATPARVPVASTRITNASTTSSDGNATTVTAPYGLPLYFAWLAMNVDQSEINRPVGFSTNHRMFVSMTGLALVVVSELFAVNTVNPTAFTHGSCGAATASFAVPGA